MKVSFLTSDAFGDFQVGWFKQVTLLHSDLIRLYIYICVCAKQKHPKSKKQSQVESTS